MIEAIKREIREFFLVVFGGLAALLYLLFAVGLPLLVIAALVKFVFG